MLYVLQVDRELGGQGRLLADKEHIYCTQIEVVEEWQRSQTIIGRMLASIKLLDATLACERSVDSSNEVAIP